MGRGRLPARTAREEEAPRRAPAWQARADVCRVARVYRVRGGVIRQPLVAGCRRVLEWDLGQMEGVEGAGAGAGEGQVRRAEGTGRTAGRARLLRRRKAREMWLRMGRSHPPVASCSLAEGRGLGPGHLRRHRKPPELARLRLLVQALGLTVLLLLLVLVMGIVSVLWAVLAPVQEGLGQSQGLRKEHRETPLLGPSVLGRGGKAGRVGLEGWQVAPRVCRAAVLERGEAKQQVEQSQRGAVQQ